MSIDTTLWVEEYQQEEKHWKGIEKHDACSSGLPAVLAKIATSSSRPDVKVVSQRDILSRLPEDVSREVLAEAKQLPDPSTGTIGLDVGWVSLSELVLFDWNTIWRTYPLYQDTYADVVGDWFLNRLVGNLLQHTDDPARVRLIYWVLA